MGIWKRDTIAALRLIDATISGLRPLATLKIIDGADHSFPAPARTGRTDSQAPGEMLDALGVVQIVVAKQDEAAAV